MNNLKSFFKPVILMHLGLAVLALFVFFWLALKFLNIYTNHGKTFIVPDYAGFRYSEILSNPSNDTYRYVILDSIFDNEREKGTVVSQNPLPGSIVKKNRKIYLTIVASQPELVSSPNLQDLTVRQATTVLETFGLKLGKIEYVPDIGSTVVRWKQMGKNISPGDKLIKGSRVNLVVGSGAGQGITFLPNLEGKSRDEARSIITGTGLNIGGEFFLNSDDTISVRVVKQNPPFSDDAQISAGSFIDLWYE